MPNQKRVFIIHGWGGNPGEAWLPWLAKNLREKGFLVEVPEMPDTDNPKIEAWTEHIQKIVGRCNENTFFVGHSIGCQAIMRYLEIASSAIRRKGGNQKSPDDEKLISSADKLGGAIFVAGWLRLSGLENEEERMTSSPWLNTPIDFEKISAQGGSASGGKARAKKFICIFSDNDPYVPAENWKMFSKNLGSEIIMEKNKGHFTDDDGATELPIVLESVLKIAQGEK